MNRLSRLAMVLALGCVFVAPAFSTQTFITNFAKNGFVTDLCSCFNGFTGVVADTFGGHGTFGASFSIPTSGFNYELMDSSTYAEDDVQISSFGYGISSPTFIYLLAAINVPFNGATTPFIRVNATNGFFQDFNLVVGDTIRGFYNSTVITNPSINVNVLKNVVEVPSYNGESYGTGSYHIDEIRLSLNAANWAGLVLKDIDINNGFYNSEIGGGGSPLIAGITVEGDVLGASGPTGPTGPTGGGPTTPEPGSIFMGLGGMAMIWAGRKRFARS